MTILEFIFGIFVVSAIVLVLIGCYGTRYNYWEVVEENEKLKEQLIKARTKRVKKEYKKVKEVK